MAAARGMTDDDWVRRFSFERPRKWKQLAQVEFVRPSLFCIVNWQPWRVTVHENTEEEP